MVQWQTWLPQKKSFFNPKLIKDCSGYHFHYFLVSSDKYVNDCFWTLYKFINWNVLCNFNNDKMLLWMSLFTPSGQVSCTRSVFSDFFVCSDYFFFHSVLLWPRCQKTITLKTFTFASTGLRFFRCLEKGQS